MARWDPGAKARLQEAAMELFVQHGYEDVTVTQIAERAGLTRRSFFRYFPDKKEVLFDGSERLPSELTEAIVRADSALTPTQAVFEAARVIGTAILENAPGARVRNAIIARSAELQERQRTKAAATADAVAAGLEARGVEHDEARLLGRVAGEVFGEAFERAVHDPRPVESFPAHLKATVTSVGIFASMPLAGAGSTDSEPASPDHAKAQEA